MTDTPETCPKCDGNGFYLLLPSGVNPFLMRIEEIAQRARKVVCRNCEGRKQEPAHD